MGRLQCNSSDESGEVNCNNNAPSVTSTSDCVCVEIYDAANVYERNCEQLTVIDDIVGTASGAQQACEHLSTLTTAVGLTAQWRLNALYLNKLRQASISSRQLSNCDARLFITTVYIAGSGFIVQLAFKQHNKPQWYSASSQRTLPCVRTAVSQIWKCTSKMWAFPSLKRGHPKTIDFCGRILRWWYIACKREYLRNVTRHKQTAN